MKSHLASPSLLALLPSLLWGSLNHAGSSLVTCLQCAPTESPKVFFFSGLASLDAPHAPSVRFPSRPAPSTFLERKPLHQSLTTFSEWTGVSHDYTYKSHGEEKLQPNHTHHPVTLGDR